MNYHLCDKFWYCHNPTYNQFAYEQKFYGFWVMILITPNSYYRIIKLRPRKKPTKSFEKKTEKKV